MPLLRMPFSPICTNMANFIASYNPYRASRQLSYTYELSILAIKTYYNAYKGRVVAGAMGFINQTLNHSINFQKIIKSSSLQMTVNFIPSSSSSSSSSQLHTNNLRSRSIIDVGEGPLVWL